MEVNCDEKNSMIKVEIQGLNKLYSKIGKREKRLIEGLIQEAGYMRITLQYIREYLDQNGWTEPFSQSEKTEPYDRKRPLAEIYLTMNKNYQSLIKQLKDMLPEEVKQQEGDGFEDFVHSRED